MRWRKKMEKTCKTCKENDCGLCDRTGRLVEDDDQCEKWASNQRSRRKIFNRRESAGNSQIHACSRQKIPQRRRSNSRFYFMCRFRTCSRVCREIFQTGIENYNLWAYTDRKLHEQRRTEGIYNGGCSRGTGIC